MAEPILDMKINCNMIGGVVQLVCFTETETSTDDCAKIEFPIKNHQISNFLHSFQNISFKNFSDKVSHELKVLRALKEF